MELDINRQMLVDVIKEGLTDARYELKTRNTITNNRSAMEKWDDINQSVYNAFKDDEEMIIVPLDRGLFKLIMMLSTKTNTLYTIIRNVNFKKLMDRKEIKRAHYIDAMLECNYTSESSPRQISMVDSMPELFSENAKEQKAELNAKIKSMFNVDEISQYITIVISFDNFTLTDIVAFKCSPYLDAIEEESLSEFITPKYDDVEDNTDVEYVQESNMKNVISIKPKEKRKLS